MAKQRKAFQEFKELLISSCIVIFMLATNQAAAYVETTSDFTLSDFALDVQRGLGALKPNDLGVATAIGAQDYKSSWDEFGTNALIDGASTPAEVQKSLTDDIINDLQMQLAYGQKDEQYLELRHSSPEAVQALEGAGGNDLLPENYIEPNPSLEANPDVNPSVLNMPAAATDTSDAFINPDTVTTPEDIPIIISDNLMPPGGEWKPVDITVFETIINDADNASIDIPVSEPSDIPASEPSSDTGPASSPSSGDAAPAAEAPSN